MSDARKGINKTPLKLDDLTGLDFDAVWTNLLIQVGNVTIEKSRTLDEQLAADERRAKLRKQIEQLERKAGRRNGQRRSLSCTSRF